MVLAGFVTGDIGLGHLARVMSDLFFYHGGALSHFHWSGVCIFLFFKYVGILLLVPGPSKPPTPTTMYLSES